MSPKTKSHKIKLFSIHFRTGVRQLGMICAGPFWGFLMDKKQNHTSILIVLSIMSMLLVSGQPLLSISIGDENTNTCPSYEHRQQLLSTSSINSTFSSANSTQQQQPSDTTSTSSSINFKSKRFLVLLFINIAASAFDGCMISLVDAGVVKRISLASQPKDFGWNRLFGAFGFSSASFLSGLASDLFPHTMAVNCFTGAYVVYFCYVFGLLISGPFLFKYSVTSSPVKSPENGNKCSCAEDKERFCKDDNTTTTIDTETEKENLKKELFETLNRFEVILFFSTVLVMGLLQGVYINFTALRMQELNSPTYLIGLTFAIAAIFCIAIFILSARLINFFGGYWKTLWLCCFSYVIRFVSFGIIDNPWFAVPIHTLQTLGFALNLVTCILYIRSISTPQIYTTMYAIMNTTFYGVGPVIASIAGGQLFSLYGGRIFLIGCGLMAAAWTVVLGVFIISKYCLCSTSRAESKASGGEDDIKDKQEEFN